MATIKQKLGFTLHEDMSVKDMTEIWNANATDAVKAAFPALNDLMEQCTAQLALQDGLRTVTEDAKQALTDIQELVTVASASLTGLVAYPATKLAEVAADVEEKLKNAEVDGKKDDIVVELDKLC